MSLQSYSIVVPQEREGYNLGMNNFDSPKMLRPGELQLLENAYPGPSLKPLNGVQDAAVSEVQLGRGTTNTLFQPYATHYHVPAGSKDWFFVWHQSTEVSFRYHILELWDLGLGTRTALIDLTFTQDVDNPVRISMTKLYNSIYLTMNAEATTNHNDEYQTRNMIIYQSGNSWATRSMGIDVAPEFDEVEVTDTVVGWAARRSHQTVVFKNKLWLIGGYDGVSAYFSDVYNSDDGKEWVKVADLPFTYAFGTALVYDEKIWLFGGGIDGGASSDEVWNSSDGISWSQINAAADWNDILNHTAVVYDNKMWVIGGQPGAPEVWNSTDGVTWTQTTADAGWGATSNATALVYNNKMWKIGGDNAGTFNDDVYSSTDGVTWTLHAAAAFGDRAGHGSVVFQGKMWVIGGVTTAYVELDDVYSSTDGITWTQETAAAAFGDRGYHACSVFDNKIILTGGGTVAPGDVAVLDDSYSSTDGVNWADNFGGLTNGKYYSVAATFVRRTDDDSVLSALADYTYDIWETIDGETVVAVDEKLLTGTVTLSGNGDNNLTGSGTDFDGEIAVGDYVRIDGFTKSYLVEDVTDDTTASVVNADSDSYTAKKFSLLPTVGDAITTTVFHPGDLEGIELIANRQVRLSYVVSTEASRLLVSFLDISDAVGQGATHVRYFRTLGDTTEAVAKGLSHRFIADIAITGDQFVQSKIYRDSLSDSVLEFLTNRLEITGYSVPPLGRYAIWANDMYWIGGVDDNDGFWFYSVKKGTEGVSFDTQFPQKFASWFKLSGDFKKCDPSDGQRDTGIIELDGDLYFFKERKVYVLYNADPANEPVIKSSTIGCAFPQSLIRAEIPKLGGEVALFVSEEGPAYLQPGGRVTLLTEFRIKTLMPSESRKGATPLGIIHERVKTANLGDPTDWYSRNKLTSAYFQHTWWIFYGDERDSNCQLNEDASGNSTWECYAFHFGSESTSTGPLKRTFQQESGENIYQPQILVPINSENAAYTFSHAFDATGTDIHYRLTRYNDPTVWVDTFDEVSNTNSIVLQTRYLFASNDWIGLRKAMFLRIFKDFEDNNGFTIVVNVDGGKLTASKLYVQTRQSGMVSTNADLYRSFISILTKDDLRSGHFFDIKLTKVIPAVNDIEIFDQRLYLGELEDREDEFWDVFDAATGVITFVHSSTGDNWISRTSAADNEWYGVIYGSDLFVAVGLTGTNRVMTSSDGGVTWTARSAPDNEWISVAYGDSLFVAVSFQPNSNIAMSSTDGITWTSRTSAADNEWTSVCYGNGLYVAVARSGPGDFVMTSPDGITWTARTAAAGYNWNSVCYGDGLYVAVASNGSNRVMTSPDGITWTLRTHASSSSWRSVCYGNGLFVAVASGGEVMTSPDGITWTSRTPAAFNAWQDVTYGNGVFVAVASSGTGNRVMTSFDGITWVIGVSAADNSWQDVTYGNGVFVAVASSGVGNRVMTSE